MTSNDFHSANAAYLAACSDADGRAGTGPIYPNDRAAMISAADAERDALRALIATPATTLAEITARAAILSSLIDGEVREEFWPELAARIAADLRKLPA